MEQPLVDELSNRKIIQYSAAIASGGTVGRVLSAVVDELVGDDEQPASTATTGATKGMGGRVLSSSEQGEFEAFGQRAQRAGLEENPNRTGSWGKYDSNGKFQESARIDVAESGKPGWRGKTHVHVAGEKTHLPTTTRIPGE
jgi:hypothetical protein